jgi:hypothetical protein
MSTLSAVFNLGLKATRRLQTAHKPLVRLMRRHARAQEHRAFYDDAEAIDRQIAGCAAGSGPIVVGPWFGEVGYEVLYWIPFLRWFQDTFGVAHERLVVVSRGGIAPAYGALAGAYVDLLDLETPNADWMSSAADRSSRASADTTRRSWPACGRVSVSGRPRSSTRR